MIKSYSDFWKNIGNFHGIATRSNYWWPIIINYCIGIIIAILFGGFRYGVSGTPVVQETFVSGTYGIVPGLVLLLVWIAMLSLTVRRLHDIDYSGWWIFIQFVPIIGQIWLLILMLLPSRETRWSN